jgi:hypothetical protein
MTMGEWLQQEGFTSKALLWYVDYCCKDDFGGGLGQVSAWAGIHYFAARRPEAGNADDETVLTWPQGNARLAELLALPSKGQLRVQQLVVSLQVEKHGVRVDAFHTQTQQLLRYEAKAVICALPSFIARRLMPMSARFKQGLEYAPWVVANLTLDELPPGAGVRPAWDNVIYEGASLGYVNAQHQGLHPAPSKTVLTHYEVLCEDSPVNTRQWMLQQDHAYWCERVCKALEPAHPELANYVGCVDVRLWGHGMIRPSPGLLSGAGRQAMLQDEPPLFFAHSDMSGLSLFEEAFTRGLGAADACLRWRS